MIRVDVEVLAELFQGGNFRPQFDSGGALVTVFRRSDIHPGQGRCRFRLDGMDRLELPVPVEQPPEIGKRHARKLLDNPLPCRAEMFELFFSQFPDKRRNLNISQQPVSLATRGFLRVTRPYRRPCRIEINDILIGKSFLQRTKGHNSPPMYLLYFDETMLSRG